MRTTKSGEPFKSDLRQHQTCGGLTSVDYTYLKNNPLLAREIVESLVAKHFPPSTFDEVLEAAKFPLSPSHNEDPENDVVRSLSKRRLRDPSFRASVLSAYEGTCAVCEFSVRFHDHDQPLAIDAV